MLRQRLCLGVILSLALLGSGCATTAKVSQFESFASAGSQYAEAVDQLLAAAGTTLVDTNSDKLLQTAKDFPGSVTEDELKKQDGALRQNLDAIDLLSRQVSLLADYFTALAALATSKSPESFGAELQTTATSLSSLSTALGRSSLFPQGADVGGLAQNVGTLALRGFQGRALEQELKARKETIAVILRLQRELLAVLEAQVQSDQQFTRDRQYESEVVAPLVAGDLSNPDGWKAKRRDLLAEAPLTEQVQNALSAAQKLQIAWAKLLTQQLTPADIQSVITDLEPILASLATLKNKPAATPPPNP